MADTIHKQKKDWPHFDKMYVNSEAYAEGYDRIFGKKKSKKKKTVRKNGVQQKQVPT